MKRVRFRTLGCYPLTGAIESERDDAAGDHPGDAAGEELRAAGPGDRPRRGGVDGAEEDARGTSEMQAVDLEFIAERHRRLPRPATSRRSCCASSPAAASTTARARSSAGCCYDTKMIYEDQLAAVQRDSETHGTTGGEIDLALLTDGLKAEREQGITIDVAYRYFSTGQAQVHHRRHARATSSTRATWPPAPRRATWPSSSSTPATACMTQTRRHSFIVSLLGIRHVVVAINKMDLVGYSRGGLRADQGRLHRLRRAARPARPALHPDVGAEGRQRRRRRATQMPWYDGPPLLHHLETVHIASRPQPDRLALPGAVRQPPEPRLPRLLPARSRRASSARATRSWRCRRGKTQPGEVDRDLRRRAGRGVRAAGGDGHADRRDRRQPRRHAGAPGQRAARRPTRSRRWSCGWPRSRSCPASSTGSSTRPKLAAGVGEPAALPRRRQHAAPRRTPTGWG